MTVPSHHDKSQRHHAQLAKWAKWHGFTPKSGPVVDAFALAMGDNQYGVEETWDAYCWFRNGFNAAGAVAPSAIERDAVIEECASEADQFISACSSEKSMVKVGGAIRALKNAAPQADSVMGIASSEKSAARPAGAAARSSPRDEQTNDRETTRGSVAESQAPAPSEPGDAGVAPGRSAAGSAPSSTLTSGPITVEEIEEFRREHHISGHADGLPLEPWAVRANLVLDYLCYRAATPSSAIEDTAMIELHLSEFKRGSNFTPVERRLMQEILRLRAIDSTARPK